MELCAVLSLLLAAIFFAGIHLGVAGTTIRDRAIAALGQSGYRVAFSIATLVGLDVIVYVLMLVGHADVVGVSPFPV